jgi:hypothetical protein
MIAYPAWHFTRLLHKTNVESLDGPTTAFFCAGSADKRKYHFVT